MRSLPAIRIEMPCFWTGVGVSYLALLMLLMRRGANPASSKVWMGLVLFSPLTVTWIFSYLEKLMPVEEESFQRVSRSSSFLK